jgi:hypothetical protein
MAVLAWSGNPPPYGHTSISSNWPSNNTTVAVFSQRRLRDQALIPGPSTRSCTYLLYDQGSFRVTTLSEVRTRSHTASAAFVEIITRTIQHKQTPAHPTSRLRTLPNFMHQYQSAIQLTKGGFTACENVENLRCAELHVCRAVYGDRHCM